MNQVPYTNDGERPVHRGGKRILPGETRLVDAAAVARPRPSDEDPAVPESGDILDLLDGTVDEVVAALPELTGDQLADLLHAEQAGKTRKTLVEALSEEQLRRADEAGDQGGGE